MSIKKVWELRISSTVPSGKFVILPLLLSPAILSLSTTVALAEEQSPELLARVREIFPTELDKMAAECNPGEIRARAYQNPGESERVSLACWEEPEADGSRSGYWLGNLPLSADDLTFAPPWSCAEGEQPCETILPQLRSRYPDRIREAEFQCAMKNGSLFLAEAEQEIDVRCGFYAASFWDEDGDGVIDYEDPVSVDISVANVQRSDL